MKKATGLLWVLFGVLCFAPGWVAAEELQADFAAERTEIAAGASVQFEDLSSGEVVAWSWSFEGGSPQTSEQQHPSVTYAAAGTYGVQLTVWDGQDRQSTQQVAGYIRVAETPVGPQIDVITWENQPTGPIYTGERISFQAAVTEGTEALAGVQWEMEGATVSGGDTLSPTAMWSKPGVYAVLCSVHDQQHQAAEMRLTVQVYPPPTLQPLWMPGPEQVYVGQAFSLQASGQGGSGPLEYHWSIDGQSIPGESRSSLTYRLQEANGVSIACVAGDGYRYSESQSIDIEGIWPIDRVEIDGPLERRGYASETLTLTARAGQGEAVRWTFSRDGSVVQDGMQGELTLPGLQLSDAGRYQVTAYDALGGQAISAEVRLEVAEPLSVSLLSGDLEACWGEDVQVESLVTGGFPERTYLWTFQGRPVPYDGVGDTLRLRGVTKAEEGTYTLTVQDAAGTTMAAAWSLRISVPALYVSLSDAHIDPQRGSVELRPQVTGGVEPYTYQWYFENQPIAGEAFAAADRPGTYTVEVTDAARQLAGSASLVRELGAPSQEAYAHWCLYGAAGGIKILAVSRPEHQERAVQDLLYLDMDAGIAYLLTGTSGATHFAISRDGASVVYQQNGTWWLYDGVTGHTDIATAHQLAGFDLEKEQPQLQGELTLQEGFVYYVSAAGILVELTIQVR